MESATQLSAPGQLVSICHRADAAENLLLCRQITGAPTLCGMIRPPVAANKYYSGAPRVLLDEIAGCLASPAPPLQLTAAAAGRGHIGDAGHLRGLIAPHGATQDSGRVAATAYSILARTAQQTTPQQPVRAILLGTNHFILQPAACLSTAWAWATPLGDVPVDRELSAELHKAGIPYDDNPHNVEHSIENQLPFLQYITAYTTNAPSIGANSPGRAVGSQALQNCSIVPISIGWLGEAQEVDLIAAALAAVLSRHKPGSVVLIATSDFTHAGPSYREPTAAPWMTLREHAIWRDSPLLHAIVSGSARAFLESCNTAGTSLCGRWPVAVFMRTAEALKWDLQLLSYAPSDLYVESGDINGFAAFAAWERTASS